MKLIRLLLILIPFVGTSQVTVTIDDQTFNVGDTVDAKFKVYGFEDIYSYQFAMEYDTNVLVLNKLELYYPYPMADIGDTVLIFPDGILSIPPCILGDFGFCKKGQIRHVWEGEGESCDDGSLVFTFSFIAKEDGVLSQSFNPSYVLTPAAYTISGDQVIYLPLKVVYVNELTNINTDNNIEVKVYPNPIVETLTVEGTDIEVQIYNTLRQLTHQAKGDNLEFIGLTKGTNFVVINTNNKTVVKKVIKL